MNKKLINCVQFGMIILFANCSPGINEDKIAGRNDSNNVEVKDLTVLSGCYRMSIGKDTAFLKLNADKETITGTLFYKRFEKDKSTGTLVGTFNRNILKTWYTYQSEGKTSVREIYFKIINNQLTEGYGDLGQKNDSIYFKYPSTLNFEEQHPYIKMDCK